MFTAARTGRLIFLLTDDILACPVKLAIFRISFIDLADARSCGDSAPIIQSIQRLQWLHIADGEAVSRQGSVVCQLPPLPLPHTPVTSSQLPMSARIKV